MPVSRQMLGFHRALNHRPGLEQEGGIWLQAVRKGPCLRRQTPPTWQAGLGHLATITSCLTAPSATCSVQGWNELAAGRGAGVGGRVRTPTSEVRKELGGTGLAQGH